MGLRSRRGEMIVVWEARYVSDVYVWLAVSFWFIKICIAVYNNAIVV